MTGFAYFIEKSKAELFDGSNQLRAEMLPDRIRSSFDFPSTFPEQITANEMRSNGPTGSAGTLLAMTRAGGGAPFIAVPQKIEWKLFSGFAIGVVDKKLPTSADLIRRQVVGGIDSFDQYGQPWKIPVARSPHAQYGTLPQTYRFDDSGNPMGRIIEKYQWLWDLSGEVFDHYTNDEKFNWQRLISVAASLLGVNYRVGQCELTVLDEYSHGILTQEFVHLVCQTLCHFSFAEEVQKKTDTEATTTNG